MGQNGVQIVDADSIRMSGNLGFYPCVQIL
jgi:hypothetical protein